MMRDESCMRFTCALRVYILYVYICFSGLRGFERDLSHRDQRKSRVCGLCLQLGHKPAHIHDLPHTHRQAALSTDTLVEYANSLW